MRWGKCVLLTLCLELLKVWKEHFGGEIFMAKFSYLKELFFAYMLFKKRNSSQGKYVFLLASVAFRNVSIKLKNLFL